jgi:hypothetical protein
MIAPRCIKLASITITVSIAACIGCLCVATVPAERLYTNNVVAFAGSRFRGARTAYDLSIAQTRQRGDLAPKIAGNQANVG